MANRDFKGVWIPKEIWENKGLSLSQKCLLVEIDSLDKGSGCYADNNHLAEFLNIKKSSLANMLSKLRIDGWIIDVEKGDNYRWISVNKKVNGVHKNMIDPSQKSERHILFSNTREIHIDKSLNFSDEEIGNFQAKFPSLKINEELVTARLYLEETGKELESYRAFFTRWLINAVKFAQPKFVKPQPEPKPFVYDN